MDICRGTSEANWLRVRDKVDLVPALRKLQTQFGGDHAAAAVGGIASDADLQLALVCHVNSMAQA